MPADPDELGDHEPPIPADFMHRVYDGYERRKLAMGRPGAQRRRGRDEVQPDPVGEVARDPGAEDEAANEIARTTSTTGRAMA